MLAHPLQTWHGRVGAEVRSCCRTLSGRDEAGARGQHGICTCIREDLTARGVLALRCRNAKSDSFSPRVTLATSISISASFGASFFASLSASTVRCTRLQTSIPKAVFGTEPAEPRSSPIAPVPCIAAPREAVVYCEPTAVVNAIEPRAAIVEPSESNDWFLRGWKISRELFPTKREGTLMCSI